MNLLLIIFWLGMTGAVVSYARGKRSREREAAEDAARRKASRARVDEIVAQAEQDAAEHVAQRRAERERAASRE